MLSLKGKHHKARYIVGGIISLGIVTLFFNFVYCLKSSVVDSKYKEAIEGFGAKDLFLISAAQSQFFFKHNKFASNLEEIEREIEETGEKTREQLLKQNYYEYKVSIIDKFTALTTATAKKYGLRSFANVQRAKNLYGHIIPIGDGIITCETIKASKKPPTPVITSSIITCPSGSISRYQGKHI